ncbi:DUF6049 family protein [Intrasporangium sp.]|uniref:DUF6049 family protein n=1 Tax=Intrasporangium sp. TaxID=1925024 RepID=UPI00293A2672|nr:DUF6049 family protein [Intrasporangium sp.]MDV3219956.1 DUF6049 family protein [Intrasporangium sp.]
MALTTLLVLTGHPALASASEPDPARPGRDDPAPVQGPLVTPDDDRAILTLTEVSPTVLDGRGETRITGSLTAPTSGPLVGARIEVVLGSRSLTVRGDIDRWAKGTGKATGRVVVETDAEPSEVPAGQTVPFSIDLEEWRVGTDAAFAALPIALEVYERGASTPIGTTRTFLSWNSRVEFVPLQIALAVPVTLQPDLKLFSNDEKVRRQAWTNAIGPGSRVDRIVEGTSGSHATLAIDPSVLVAGPDELTGTPPGGTSTTPPTTAPPTEGPDGSDSDATVGPPTAATTAATTPATPSPADTPTSAPADPSGAEGGRSSPLVDRLVSSLRGRSLVSLPYADADVAATGDIDPDNPVVRALVARATAVGARIGEPVRGDIAWPADGLFPAGRDDDVQSLWSTSATKQAAGIIVDQRAITAPSPYTPTARRVSANGTRLLGYDRRLSALLPKRSDPSPTLSTQRFLAETLVLLGELPGIERSVLVAAPRGYDPDPDALSAFLRATTDSIAWLDPVDLDALLTDDGGDQARVAEQPAKPPGSAAPKPTLSEFRLSQLAEQRHTLDAVATVVQDGVAFERTYGELLDELASVRWRYRPAAWGQLNNSVTKDVRNATSAIRVVPRRINFLAENGTLRITLENGLGYAVDDLRLVVTPLNPRLQIVEQPGPVSISAGPGARSNVSVPVHAVAAGRADILAYLTTADGTRIGSEARIPVSANPLDSTFYWIGGVLAGLVLLAGVIRTVLKGTSRIDDIGDLDAIAERDEAALGRIRD